MGGISNHQPADILSSSKEAYIVHTILGDQSVVAHDKRRLEVVKHGQFLFQSLVVLLLLLCVRLEDIRLPSDRVATHVNRSLASMVQIGKNGENNTLQQRERVLYRICADSEPHCPVRSWFQWIQKVFLFSIRVILLCVFCEGSNNNNKLLQSLWCSKTPDFFFFFLKN